MSGRAPIETLTWRTGTESPEALAGQMTAAEDNKHRLFSFVNELNSELEGLDTQISLLQQELKDTSKTANARLEASSKVQQVGPASCQTPCSCMNTHLASVKRGKMNNCCCFWSRL